jgi:ElaB/YqjD/DUF883 family membrane-anchored ribosome-binding protein
MNMLDPVVDQDIEVAGDDDFIDDTYNTAESWVERRLVDARDTIREEPIKTVLIAAAIGAVLGRIFLFR